jgi:hypothetical protein
MELGNGLAQIFGSDRLHAARAFFDKSVPNLAILVAHQEMVEHHRRMAAWPPPRGFDSNC